MTGVQTCALPIYTNLRNYAVFDNGRLEIKSYDALMGATKAR